MLDREGAMTKNEFDALVETYYPDLIRFALRHVYDAVPGIDLRNAKDAAHDLVLSAIDEISTHQSYTQFQGRSTPKTWLIGAVKNHAFRWREARIEQRQ